MQGANIMNSEKTLYWVAVAVVALFAGNHFAAKYQGDCLGGRAIAAVQHVGAEAIHVAAMAESVFDETPSFAGSEQAFAKVQGHLAYVQSRIARQQLGCAREQAQHARMIALQQMQRLRVVCPRQSITVELPRTPSFISE
jgi:hypothetical protein